MYTVKSAMAHLADPNVILQNVCSTLRKIDPQFVKEEQQYYTAVAALKEEIGNTVSPSANEYIAAKEQEICAEIVYLVWLGFQQNLECYQNPVNTMFLKLDYEDFLRERRLHTLPDVKNALKTIDAFHKVLHTLPGEKMNLTDGITDFMCYLETTGFKLAHYFGFILADDFLPHVIPGYCKDPVTTIQYTWSIRDYLKLDPEQLL